MGELKRVPSGREIEQRRRPCESRSISARWRRRLDRLFCAHEEWLSKTMKPTNSATRMQG
jgi:hypothetical protein